ncbi:hypothetical protein DDZ14_12890 [Maritimibacter sp. 55A14]|uniref:hypothetical protein n=1 Tax=Maritimibacter sp. 55A14 TaxID=2174844 RepID=UPI000D60F8F1|nr:hypothetical protein [Maritimibacter sp. 55A14]PWE31404.1 hypothetical protein DDZ14_12890 [Maritimibacter sp. 55A14]
MTTEPTVIRHRVILGATCYADAEAALHLAVELGRRLGAEIQGLLVSDETILSAAGHPKARVVSYSGTSVSQVTAEAMRSAFRADARLFERQLQRRAAAAALGVSFRAEPGRLASVLAGAAGAGDLVIFGYRRAIRDGDSVVLVAGGDGMTTDALRTAVQLRAILRKRLVVLTAATRQREVVAALADLGEGPAELRVVSSDADLLRALDRMSPAAVVMASAPADLALVVQVVEAARSPVIVPFGDAGPPPGGTA